MIGFKCIVLLLLVNSMRIDGQTVSGINELCLVSPNGVLLTDPDSCNSYYQCSNGVATAQTCKTGEGFDKDSQKCVLSTQVDCSTIDTSNPCSGKTNQFAANPSNCNAYFWCNANSVAQGANCPSGQYFNPSTQSCIYESDSACVDNPTAVDTSNVCYFMPNNYFFGSTSDCSAYNICIDGVLKDSTCGTYAYNTQTQSCVYASTYSCPQLTNPQPDSVGGPCTGSGNSYTGIVTGAACNLYYSCDGTNYILTKCKDGQFYDTSSNICVDEVDAVNPDCNRCANHNKGFVAAQEGPNYYYTCVDGVPNPTEPDTCPQNYYFNQKIQACLTINPGYACCTGEDASGDDSGDDSGDESGTDSGEDGEDSGEDGEDE